ncbi:hypothetical protein [Rhizobium sp. 1399]|uniref:hypothetical protein n=1 Tax=Rhizobium sp. 1399 TaxID=2817758 RepID=UPI0028654043|nr:hypothetical protein [Rhizobium sp. 1399]MDR6663999.1 hypothetical protein [Rhizobium sp. 1399]
MSAAIQIERLHNPAWNSRFRPRPSEMKLDVVRLGSEYDIAHICRVWQRVMLFKFDCLPDDLDVMWSLADVLLGNFSRPGVYVSEAVVSIDRKLIEEFRQQVDFIWDHLCEEHNDDLYELVGDNWERIEGVRAPIVSIEDANRAHDIIMALYPSWAENVVQIRESA